MPTQSAARKAWNEAMRATAGAAALPPGLVQQRMTKRRSDRHKKQDRRAKARKVSHNSNHLSTDDAAEAEEYRAAVWIDALEGIDPSRQLGEEDDDDEYDELDELEKEATGKGGTKKRKRGAARKASSKAGVLPKRFLPRSLASVLVEEAGREDGVARALLNSEARLPKHQQLPVRKFCPVTGTEAVYTEPKSGVPYSTFRALEQIRERPPPWTALTGSAAYWEAAKSIRDED